MYIYMKVGDQLGEFLYNSVVGTKIPGSTKDMWFTQATQAIVHETDKKSKFWGNTMQKQLTAIIEREGNGYVSLCPQLDIASQGDTIEEARINLREAIELFFETASPTEIQTRLHEEVYVTQVEIAVG